MHEFTLEIALDVDEAKLLKNELIVKVVQQFKLSLFKTLSGKVLGRDEIAKSNVTMGAKVLLSVLVVFH